MEQGLKNKRRVSNSFSGDEINLLTIVMEGFNEGYVPIIRAIQEHPGYPGLLAKARAMQEKSDAKAKAHVSVQG